MIQNNRPIRCIHSEGCSFLTVDAGGILLGDASHYSNLDSDYNSLTELFMDEMNINRELNEHRSILVDLDDDIYDILVVNASTIGEVSAIVFGPRRRLETPSGCLSIIDRGIIDDTIDFKYDEYKSIGVVGIPSRIDIRVGLYLRYSRSDYDLWLRGETNRIDWLEKVTGRRDPLLLRGICVEWEMATHESNEIVGAESSERGSAAYEGLRIAVMS